jgi:hypothetical protein
MAERPSPHHLHPVAGNRIDWDHPARKKPTKYYFVARRHRVPAQPTAQPIKIWKSPGKHATIEGTEYEYRE